MCHASVVSHDEVSGSKWVIDKEKDTVESDFAVRDSPAVLVFDSSGLALEVSVYSLE